MQLVECPLQQDRGRVVTGEEETAEGVASLLKDPRSQPVDALKAEGCHTSALLVGIRANRSQRFVLSLDLSLEDAIKSFIRISNQALVCRKVVSPSHASKRPFVEGLGEGTVSQKYLGLLSVDLGIQIHVERDNANDIENEICSVRVKSKALAGRSLLFHKTDEHFSLVHNDINQTEEMIGLEAGADAFVETVPFVALYICVSCGGVESIARLTYICCDQRSCADKRC